MLKIMSHYCKACVVNEKIKHTNPEKYKEIIANHVGNRCKANYKGSAPAIYQKRLI